LEKFYCLSDLPIPLLYKKLDKLYPGSKFILTLRDEEDWIESVRKHWSHENNKFRERWASDPFTHKVHKLLYGQKGFDRDKFISRYRLHNAEVVDYFKGRDSLLIMDMTKGAGWRELCPFLAKPVPPIPYPLAYRSLPCARLSPEGDLSHEK
jgi:hypothetical protein